MAKEKLENFQKLVLRDLSLQEKLRDITDREAFIVLTVRLGEEYGCSFRREDVEEALRASRRAWGERWL
ncbi:MAG: Nif11-like leader peptide family natural product precursor [Pyrinomonadaceae bacterium]